MNIPAHLIGHLPCLSAVARYQSFTRAAESLNISQAAVSYQIRQLEDKLNLTLVVRQSGSKITLTNAGQLLADEYRACDKRLRMVLDTLNPEKLQGVLRLTAPVDFGSLILPHFLAEIKQEAPKLKVELSVTDSVVDLPGSDYDFAIRSLKVGDGLHHEPLVRSQKSLVASPHYIQQRGLPKTLADLHQHTLLIREGQNTSWQQLLSSHKLKLADYEDTMVLGNTFALAEGAMAGLGIAILPDFAIKEALEDNKLLPLLQDHRDRLFTDFCLSYVPTTQAEIIKTFLVRIMGSKPFL